MKSNAAKAIAKAFAEQAESVPLRPLDEAALRLQIETHRIRRAERDAALATYAADVAKQVAPASSAPRAIADSVPAIHDALQSLKVRATLPTPDALRAYTLAHEVLPRLKAWGFERRFRRELTAWNCPEQEATFQVCRKKLCGVGAVVALIGKRGTGKTTIAAQLALERAWRERIARESGRPGFITTFAYRKVTSLVQRFKPLYANFGSIDTEALTLSLERLVHETDVLVIDEMHDLSELAVREALLIDLTDRRYAALRDTLLISNQTPEEWDAQTPVSTQSRIQEHGCVLKCEWQSWREKP